MVLVNSISEKVRYDSFDVNKNMYPYVYLIDNARKMMLIMKRDFSEMSVDPVTDNSPLSFREKEILRYAALGKSNKQIGKIVGRSECTIKNHFSRILRKLHANDRTHAVALALCNGWLPGLSRE